MPGRLNPRELGEESRDYFLSYAGALRRQLKIGGLELFLAPVKGQGWLFSIGRLDQLRSNQVVGRGLALAQAGRMQQ